MDAPLSQVPASPNSGMNSLDRSFAHGVAWTAGTKWFSQVLSWASLIIIAHLLSPSDFGLVGMATIYLGLVALFSEFGVGTAVLTLRDLTEEQVAQLNSVSVLLGVSSFLISCALAVPLGHFFRAPELPAVILAQSTTFVILSVRSVPYGLLQKDLRFKLVSVLETSQSVFQAAGTLCFAYFGFGYWALVLGNVLGSVLLTAMTALFKRHRFAPPRFSSIRGALRFTGHLLIARLSWYAYSNSDFLVAGRVLGVSPLGEYSFAWNLVTAPSEKIYGIIGRVAPAFFSAVQDEYASLRRYLRVLTEGMCIVILPATIGLALVAREFIPFALGRKWEGAIVPLQLLALYVSPRTVVPLLTQVLNVTGESRFSMWNSVAALIVMPTAFYVGSRWGIAGIAAVWIIAYPFVAAPLFWRTLSKIHMSLGEYLRGVLPPLNGCIAMAIVVGLLKLTMPVYWQLYLRLGLEVVGGASVYIFVMTVFYRTRMRALWQIARNLQQREM